jgi:hypothetical protein
MGSTYQHNLRHVSRHGLYLHFLSTDTHPSTESNELEYSNLWRLGYMFTIVLCNLGEGAIRRAC